MEKQNRPKPNKAMAGVVTGIAGTWASGWTKKGYWFSKPVRVDGEGRLYVDLTEETATEKEDASQ